jgi:lycopene beta-cyclase
MLFMDWRDSHLQTVADLRENNDKLPTFLYAMPFSKTRVFVEETSLVARPALNFDELKDRMYARLKHLGIKVCSAGLVVSHACLQMCCRGWVVRGSL